MSYKIVRIFSSGSRYTLCRGLTLEEAQNHCNDPETSWRTCSKPTNKRRTRERGEWFDAYSKE